MAKHLQLSGIKFSTETVVVGNNDLAALLSRRQPSIFCRASILKGKIQLELAKNIKAKATMPRKLRDLHISINNGLEDALFENSGPRSALEHARNSLLSFLDKEDRAAFGCDRKDPEFASKLSQYAAYVEEMRSKPTAKEKKDFAMREGAKAFGRSILVQEFEARQKLAAEVGKQVEFYSRLISGISGISGKDYSKALISIADSNSESVPLYLTFQPNEPPAGAKTPKVSLIYASGTDSEKHDDLEFYEQPMVATAMNHGYRLELREPLPTDSLPPLPKKVNSLVAVGPEAALGWVSEIFSGIVAAIFREPESFRDNPYASAIAKPGKAADE